MKRDLDHLPPRQQTELATVRTVLLTEFEAALHSGGGGGTSEWRRGGQVLNFTPYNVQRRIEQVAEQIASCLEDLDTADWHEGDGIEARSMRLTEKIDRLRADGDVEGHRGRGRGSG